MPGTTPPFTADITNKMQQFLPRSATVLVGMRTQKQIEASRRNGARSKGPVTVEGRARSSRNAITHGLSSRAVVLRSEDQEQFDRLPGSYMDYWCPASQIEADLVHDIVAARWRLSRVPAIETAALDVEMDRQREDVDRTTADMDVVTRCSLAFTSLANTDRSLAILNRHEARLYRMVERATARLVRLNSGGSEPETRQSAAHEKFTKEPENDVPAT